MISFVFCITQLSQRRLHTIKPEEANQIFAHFMKGYQVLGRGTGLPHLSMLNWPTPQALENNFKHLSDEYARSTSRRAPYDP